MFYQVTWRCCSSWYFHRAQIAVCFPLVFHQCAPDGNALWFYSVYSEYSFWCQWLMLFSLLFSFKRQPLLLVSLDGLRAEYQQTWHSLIPVLDKLREYLHWLSQLGVAHKKNVLMHYDTSVSLSMIWIIRACLRFKENVGHRLPSCSLFFQVKPFQTTTPLLRSVSYEIFNSCTCKSFWNYLLKIIWPCMLV